MLDSLGSLTGSPWIYAVVALSVLLDVFLPVLPSGVLVITAATAAAAGTSTVVNAADQVARVPREVPSLLILMFCAAGASVLGDLAAFRLAWRGGDRLDRAIARSHAADHRPGTPRRRAQRGRRRPGRHRALRAAWAARWCPSARARHTAR